MSVRRWYDIVYEKGRGKNLLEQLSELNRLQDTRSTYKSQLYFYMLTRTVWKWNLKTILFTIVSKSIKYKETQIKNKKYALKTIHHC